jgi:hypothetical protein
MVAELYEEEVHGQELVGRLIEIRQIQTGGDTLDGLRGAFKSTLQGCG